MTSKGLETTRSGTHTYDFFFCHKLLRCHLTIKISMRLTHPSIFDGKTFQIFLVVFAIFLNFLFISEQFFLQPHRTPKHADNLHGPCGPDYLRSHKISDFILIFFTFFNLVSSVYCSWRGQQGWLCSGTPQWRKMTGFESSWCNLSGFRVEGPKVARPKNRGTKNGLFSKIC